VSGVAEYIS